MSCARALHHHYFGAFALYRMCLPSNTGTPGKRKFVPHWKKGRPWLQYVDDKMLCVAYRAYPQRGSLAEWS